MEKLYILILFTHHCSHPSDLTETNIDAFVFNITLELLSSVVPMRGVILERVMPAGKNLASVKDQLNRDYKTIPRSFREYASSITLVSKNHQFDSLDYLDMKHRDCNDTRETVDKIFNGFPPTFSGRLL